jgi:hypothetical protein
MKQFAIIFSLLLVFSACKFTQQGVNGKAEKNETAGVDTIIMVVETPVEPIDSLVISFEKTPCFGRCPVYKVKVYASGFATYEGINFSERLGLYSCWFTDLDIERIYQSALAIDFFELEDEYNNPLVSDLPSTQTRINLNGQDHKVKARMNVPEKLKMFQSELEDILLDRDWESYNGGR